MTLWNFFESISTASRFKRLGRFLASPSGFLYPSYIISRADFERTSVDRFIQNIKIASNLELLLDAGAGNFRFKQTLLDKNYNYESHDFDQVFDQDSRGKHTYVSDIISIPVEDSRFNVVVCTQVLEHLPEPLAAFKELARILKPNGELFLTTNLLFPVHGAPYDFFRFTSFGLEHLCRESGFSEIEITPRGGFFRFFAKVVFDLPSILTSWIFFDGASPHGQRELKLKSWPLIVLLLPLVFVLDLTCTLLAFLISQFDWMDKKQRFTLGYQLYAKRA
jgi:SAM-dependent methyltransferase